MGQLIYAMRFTGTATPSTSESNVFLAITMAPSCSLSSIVGASGLAGTNESVSGEDARFESEVRFTGENRFLESGAIHFGDEHWLRFSSVGEGSFEASAEAGLNHGTIAWRVEEGGGQFAGASGLITSNFFISDQLSVTDHQFGVLFVN